MTRTANHDTNIEVRSLAHELAHWVDFRTVKVALDVGSRDALVSLALADFLPNATVYAFECNPAALELCRRNIGGHRNVVLVERAVSDVNGPLEFFAIDPEKTITPHADGNIGASSLYRADPGYPDEKYVQKSIVVESTTLLDWARGNGVTEIDLIWMDLQGAELRALRGLGELLQRVRMIYTEVEYRPMYVGQPLAREVMAFLEENGFVYTRTFSGGEWMANVLFRRKDVKARTLGHQVRHVAGKATANVAGALRRLFQAVTLAVWRRLPSGVRDRCRAVRTRATSATAPVAGARQAGQHGT